MKRANVLCAVTMAAFCGAAIGQQPVLAETNTQIRVPQSQAEIQLSFVPLVREAAPAVVSIYASRVVQERVSPFPHNPLFDELFRDFGHQTRPQVKNGLGSGVLLRSDGLLVSNHHVVEDADDIRVVMNDQREYEAEVLLSDRDSDLAVLKLKNVKGDLPTLSLRDSDQVETGELVLAIGNPFGVGQTVTSGIVSALSRSALELGQGYFIQTDAAINPGNSGGALIDASGKLIGINSAILTRSGGSNGIGFAIPANLVAEVVRQAEAGERQFHRPWAGFSGQAVDWQMAEALGLERPRGVLVTATHAEGPFAKVGVKAGDVILGLGGLDISSPQEGLYRLAVAGIGRKLAVSWLSEGQLREGEVMLDHAPGADIDQVARSEAGFPEIAVAEINPALIARFHLPLQASGLLVIEASPRAAAAAGLQAGDLILSINGIELASLGDYEQVTEPDGRRRRWQVELLRDGQRYRTSFAY